jgi:hypothetical protein
MTNALIFRALERNTGSVGLASVPCTSIKPLNPEIAALEQHQDPAGNGAADLNKQIAAELARQIASVGGDPTLANEASTFAPGKIGDQTGAGNTCDDADDAAGCINSQNLRVDDLSAAEISAAVADISGGAAEASNGTAKSGSNVQACAAINANNTASAGNAANAATGNNAGNAADNQNASAGDDNAADAGNAASGAAAADLGNCNAKINFGTPSDGRQQDAFEPADLSTFNHGSALNIDVISNFICSQITNKCDISAADASSCDAAASAAKGLKGQAAADAFNSALGL